MNNDNLKRVLNKISGAAQRLPEDQLEQTTPQPEDQIEETTPPPLTFQEKINKYCACVKNLLDNVSILETEKDGWEAHVKWVTTYCLGSIQVLGIPKILGDVGLNVSLGDIMILQLVALMPLLDAL